MTEIIDKLKNELNSIRESLNEILGFKTYLESFKKVINFFDTFFSIVPPELILLLLFCGIVLILVNNISPTTPRLNITMAVVLFCGVWLYVNHLFTGEYRFIRVFYTSLFILVPAYGIEISRFTYRKIANAKKINNSRDLIDPINELHLHYYQLVKAQASMDANPADFKDALRKIKETAESIEKRIE